MSSKVVNQWDKLAFFEAMKSVVSAKKEMEEMEQQQQSTRDAHIYRHLCEGINRCMQL